jgi:hypothetical protein
VHTHVTAITSIPAAQQSCKDLSELKLRYQSSRNAGMVCKRPGGNRGREHASAVRLQMLDPITTLDKNNGRLESAYAKNPKAEGSPWLLDCRSPKWLLNVCDCMVVLEVLNPAMLGDIYRETKAQGIDKQEGVLNRMAG